MGTEQMVFEAVLPLEEVTPKRRVARASMIRVKTEKIGGVPLCGEETSNPRAVANLIERVLDGATDREHFVVLCLSAKNRVNAIEIVSTGTLTASLVHPREVFKGAILANAHAVIVAHNHPSGDPALSREDQEVTRRLVQAGKLIGIEVLDHVVVGDDGRYTSFRERGLLA